MNTVTVIPPVPAKPTYKLEVSEDVARFIGQVLYYAVSGPGDLREELNGLEMNLRKTFDTLMKSYTPYGSRLFSEGAVVYVKNPTP